MNIKELVMLGGFGLAAATYYNNYIADDKDKIGFIPSFNSGGILGDVFGGAGSGEIYDVENTKTISQKPITNQDFKMNLYEDNYKNSSSGSKKSRKRKYIQNDDLDFTVVKDNDKTVGGFDFVTKQNITAKRADFLETNKNNPFLKISRNISSSSSKKSKKRVVKKDYSWYKKHSTGINGKTTGGI